MKLHHKILLAMLLSIALASPALAQQNGFHREYTTMAGDTTFTHAGGSQSSAYAARFIVTADQISDSVVWGRKVPLTPFDGAILIDQQSFNSSVVCLYMIRLHHLDSLATIIGGGGNLGGAPGWGTDNFNQSWSGNLSMFDSISIVVWFHPWSPLGTQTADLDNFRNGAGTVFYDGGEKGQVQIMVFNDRNQNHSQESGEAGLKGWTVHLNSVLDSAVTDQNGQCTFPELDRSTSYYLTVTPKQPHWNQTFPVAGDTHHVSFITTLDTSCVFGFYGGNAAGTFSVTKRWNLVSLPITTVDSTVVAIYPSAISPAYKYATGTGYVQAETLRRGVGYWLKFASSQEVTMTGDSSNVDTIDVMPGWNLIGSITDTIATANITARDEVTLSDFYEYSDGYHVTKVICPGKGYWVKASQPTGIILSAVGSGPGKQVTFITTNELPPEAPGVAKAPPPIPLTFTLEQNYPNPFNPTTTIKFALPKAVHVSLKVYNLLGQEVATLMNEVREAGTYKVTWDGSNVTSGTYYYRLNAGGHIATKTMVLVK